MGATWTRKKLAEYLYISGDRIADLVKIKAIPPPLARNKYDAPKTIRAYIRYLSNQIDTRDNTELEREYRIEQTAKTRAQREFYEGERIRKELVERRYTQLAHGIKSIITNDPNLTEESKNAIFQMLYDLAETE